MTTRVVHVNDKVEGAVYIGRTMPKRRLLGSLLCNPFRIGKDGDRAKVIARYSDWLWDSPGLWRLLPELRGKPLACWCRRDGAPKSDANACHGDVLVELLERYTDDELRAMAACVVQGGVSNA